MSARRMWSRVRGIAAAVGLAGAAACASSRPMEKLSVTTQTGQLVPIDSLTVSYTVGGLQVIQRPNFANDVVAVHLYLLGGTRQLTPATQGIEEMLLRASDYGTLHYPGDAARTAWALTGSDLELDPRADYTLFGFRGIRQTFDSSWNVFADRVMHPTLSAATVKLVRGRMVADLQSLENDPDGLLSYVADSVAFAGHPYGLHPIGTEASLASLDSAALARYEATQMVTSRMLLVVVGAVTHEQVERAVAATLATLPHGGYVWTPPPDPKPTPTSVTLIERPLSTNYILGFFEGPRASDPQAPAFRLAMALLSSGVDDTVRQQHALSYAASAPVVERAITSGGVYVSTTQPNLVLPMIRRQIEDLHEFHVGFGYMHYYTDGFVLDYLAHNITDASQADFLARAQLYEGDYHKAAKTMEAWRRVSSEGVAVAARRYMRDIHFVYLGDTTRVSRAAFTKF